MPGNVGVPRLDSSLWTGPGGAAFAATNRILLSRLRTGLWTGWSDPGSPQLTAEEWARLETPPPKLPGDIFGILRNAKWVMALLDIPSGEGLPNCRNWNPPPLFRLNGRAYEVLSDGQELRVSPQDDKGTEVATFSFRQFPDTVAARRNVFCQICNRCDSMPVFIACDLTVHPLDPGTESFFVSTFKKGSWNSGWFFHRNIVLTCEARTNVVELAQAFFKAGLPE